MGLFGSSSPFDPLLDKATNEQATSEDWSLILSICDKARASSKNGKDCLSAITKKLGHRVPRVALQALVVLDACVSNSGKEFQKLVSSQDFINELRPLVSRADLVGEKVRGLIKKWSKEFENEAELSLIVSFYHYLRSAGAHFPAEEGEKRRPVNTNPDAVDSQREADEIAMAIQMSLNEEKQKEKQKQEQKQPETPSLYYSTLQNSGPSGGRQAKALYDFEAAEDNELTFKTGDIITLIETSDANWWEGELNGKTGLFPSNFVEAIENTTNNAGSAEPQKKDDQNERVVVKVDEKLLDSTLYAVESVDPTIEDDEPGMIKNEQICKQMGALIDAKLSEMDTEQIEYTQLNQKLLQCLHLYDTLMQQEQFSNPYMLNQQMGNMSLQTNMGYGGDPQMYSGHQMPPQNQYPPQMTQPMAHPMNHQPMTNQNQAYHSEHQQQHMSQPISQPMSQPQTTNPQSHQQMAPMSQPQATQPQQMPPQQMTSQQMPQQMSQPPPQMAQQVPPTMQHLPPDQQTPGNYAVYEPTAPPPTPPVSQQQFI